MERQVDARLPAGEEGDAAAAVERAVAATSVEIDHVDGGTVAFPWTRSSWYVTPVATRVSRPSSSASRPLTCGAERRPATARSMFTRPVESRTWPGRGRAPR